MQIINTLDEIIDSEGKLIDKNIVDMDLSNLDLSHVDPKVWEKAFFANSIFDNTNIKFIPCKLSGETYSNWPPRYINNCSFKNCDLSYLKDEDLRATYFINCDLSDTNLNIDFRNNKVFSLIYNDYCISSMQDDIFRVKLSGTKLPENYLDKAIDYFDYATIDIEFIKKNPHIKFHQANYLKLFK